MNNLVYVVFDSCRYDTFCAAGLRQINRLGPTVRGYSYASWTVPSHAVSLMGVLPHQSRPGELASDVYCRDFRSWTDRLGIPDISFRGFLPHLSLPAFLQQRGYRTAAFVSMPVLNKATILNRHFHTYDLMERHNDFSAIIDRLTFEPDAPSFYFINTGETHYPYLVCGETAGELPVLHGVHGVLKHMDDHSVEGAPQCTPGPFPSPEQMALLKDKQRKNVEHLDRLFEKLFDAAPPNTHFIVTSDHGELFGEDGYFGHGPIFHEKVFEVFFVEGRIK